MDFDLFLYDTEKKELKEKLEKSPFSQNIFDNILYANRKYAKSALAGKEGDCYSVATVDKNNDILVYFVGNILNDGVCITDSEHVNTFYSFELFETFLLTGNNKLAKRYTEVDFPAVFENIKDRFRSFIKGGNESKIGYMQFDFIPHSVMSHILLSLDCKLGTLIASKQGVQYLNVTYLGSFFVIGLHETSVLFCTRQYFTTNLIKNEVIKG